MFAGRISTLFASIAVAAVAPALMGALGRTEDFAGRVLAAQNLEREDIGVPAMRWNPALAADAQGWADYLARTGRFEHAPETPANPQGENICAGTNSYFSPEAMVSAWIREKRYFKPGVFPNNSTTGDVEDVGHFTQVAWRQTGEVGCGVATSRREDILVCRYAKAGNWIG